MKKILLIEDNDDIRNNIAEILVFANYDVYTAENGKTGIHLALTHKPDLIVCDIMMPVMDGYGVINIVQKNPETQHIPFIFLTAKTERNEVRKGMSLGADDYITKPFDEVELLEAIERRLKKIDFLKEKYASDISGYNKLIKEVSNSKNLETIISEHSEKTFKKKTVIYYEGNHPLNLYYIQKGVVKAYKINDDGKELSVDLYGPGDFFGYTALLNDKTYKDSTQAIEDSEIVIIPKIEFEELLMSNIENLKKFTQILAGNISEKEQRLLDIAYNSVRKKVASILIELYHKKNTVKGEACIIDISRDNMASLTGLTKETTIRVLSDFNSEKRISIQSSIITITDLKGLEKMIN